MHAAEVAHHPALAGRHDFRMVGADGGVVHHDVESGWPEKFPFERFDALLVLDTGTWSQLPDLREQIQNVE